MTAVAMLFSPWATSEADQAGKVPERSEIDQQYLWKTEAIYATPADWQAEFAVVEQKIEELAKLRGTLDSGAARLLHALTLRDETAALLEKVSVYASLLADQDTRVNENEARRSRARSLGIKYGQATSWMAPELTAIPFAKLESQMSQSDELAVYRHAFDDLFRQKKHILSEREEELIAMAGEVFATPGTTYNLFANADLAGQYPEITDDEGNPAELSDSAFYLFMRSPDRRVRKEAYEGIVGTYARFRNTAAALLNGVVQSHVFTVKAREYESCLAAALDGGNIPIDVYNTLVKTVNDNLPLLHRYQAIRRRALRLDDGVHAYDLFAPFVSEATLEYTYEEGVDTATAALAPLGPDYLSIMKKGLASRWVDVYPSKGKRSGAYSSGSYLTQPYVLLNYHGGYDDVSTLAHELGHSLHSHLSRSTQPYVYADYATFCAEVASTTNEILLQDYVLERIQDPQRKLYLLVELLETFRGTVFRQTMFSEFEQRVHEMAEQGQPLTAAALGAAYGEIMKRYYGPDYTHDDLVDNYWIRIPHFYYNFYVYKYATSFCAASNIARRITEARPGAVEAYLTFLKSGSSKYPIELLKAAGVDMTTPEPIQDAMRHFAKLLDQTEELLGKVE